MEGWAEERYETARQVKKPGCGLKSLRHEEEVWICAAPKLEIPRIEGG